MNTVLDIKTTSREWCSLTTSQEIPLTTAGSRKDFTIESCHDAIRFTSVTWRIPPENSKLHLRLIMKVSITNLGKYINIYFQNTTLHYTQLFNFYTNTGQRTASQISVLGTVSMFNPSFAFLYYPFRWCSLSLKHNMTMTSATLELKQKRLLWAMLTNNNHKTSFAIVFNFAHTIFNLSQFFRIYIR